MWRPIVLAFAACSACATPREPMAVGNPVPAAPRTCALVRGAYCIEDIGLVIDQGRPTDRGTPITFYEEDWRDRPVVLTEPPGCRKGLSDTIQWLNVDRSDETVALTIRLRADASCDLQITAGGKSRDPGATGFFTALTQIRACTRAPCEGVVLAGPLSSQVHW